MKKLVTLLALALLALPPVSQALTVTRGPYLQMGSTTAVTVRWKTDTSSDSKVKYGTSPTNLNLTATNATSTTNHVIRLTGLTANTIYYYSVGSSGTVLASGSSYFFKTAPSGAQPTRIWVLGDSGTANANQKAVRDAYYSFTGSRHTDLWLMLGDNAYPDGTDTQYQNAVFNIYQTMLRKSVLWPTLGNHDGHSADSSAQTGPYYNVFTLPKNAEAGGVASGTEAYYSFNYGNIHFVCLNSYDVSRSTTGPMATWLKNDLANNTKPWLVAFWHHPPYSKGSHDSDSETQLKEMRLNIVPILEANGVDLVFCGHSHSYERSKFIDGHYGNSGTFSSSMVVQTGSGRDAGAYTKATGSTHSGTVYTVAGSSGQTDPVGSHPAMYISLSVLGSVVLDFDGLRVDAQFLDSAGTRRDYFSMVKQ
jgi:acid phosphatase type 7